VSPTELLPEVLKMRFEEAYTGWREGRLTQEEAAHMLGVCETPLKSRKKPTTATPPKKKAPRKQEASIL
jgi:hypothetical protein